MKKKNKVLASLIASAGLLYFYNKNQLSRIKIRHYQIPTRYDLHQRIIQLSDIHQNPHLNYHGLVEKITAMKPDYIFITGDSIDRRSKDVAIIDSLYQRLNQIAPLYIVLGNHDLQSEIHEEYFKIAKNYHVLMDDKISLKHFDLYGFNHIPTKKRDSLVLDPYRYSILLVHNPVNGLDFLADLTLSGHTHGGQIRFPWIGGIIAPDQGVFPHYQKGFYPKGNGLLYIDSGLGCSRINIRSLNPVQLTCIDLI
ncbi:MAG: metallophosphoesterase [Tissierellia bacterium]|nr:metallophosphoesterase [Tissierellia bacterium]